MKIFIYILALITLCAASYQVGLNHNNDVVHGEIKARSAAEKELMDMKIRILQEEVEEIRANGERIFEFATGAGMK